LLVDDVELSKSVSAVRWAQGCVKLLDQRKLPNRTEYLEFHDAASLAKAISEMVVRGAPAIGIAAAYGVVLAARDVYKKNPENWRSEIENDLKILSQSRPTAVNLNWAIKRMRKLFDSVENDPEELLLKEAKAIHQEDFAANKKMGQLGAEIIRGTTDVLTHCNAGALATGGYGTALGVIRTAFINGKLHNVYINETRPWLQGARLTSWELLHEGIPVTLITDSAASHLFKQGKVEWVIVGADRIAANGDVANKIGTYALAVSARYHDVQLMVVAPTSTFDLNAKSGTDIPIENRAPEELTSYSGNPVAPLGVSTWNPVFDITPANLIDVIVTEKGVIYQPDEAKIALLFSTED